MLRRTISTIGACATLIIGPTVAVARTGAHAAAHKRSAHSLRETETQIALSESGSRSTNVGVLDGRIGGHPVHGAIRATATFTGSGTGTGRRTEFDQYGSRTATLTFRLVTNPNGSKTDTGSGHWIAGTGLYKGATGAFTFKGTIPPGTTEITATWVGSIVY